MRETNASQKRTNENNIIPRSQNADQQKPMPVYCRQAELSSLVIVANVAVNFVRVC